MNNLPHLIFSTGHIDYLPRATEDRRFWAIEADTFMEEPPSLAERKASLKAQQKAFLFGEAAEAAAAWAGVERPTWAVDVTAGPYNRPTYKNTVYCRAANSAEAIQTAKNNMFRKPARARYHARLASPRELGCTPSPRKD